MRDFEQVRMFLKLAELGGISLAARALGLPHSTVSRQLAQLETRIGARLVQRSTRSFRLTPAGDVVRREFLKIAQAQEAIEVELRGDEVAGRLRISASHAFAVGMIGPTLPLFARRHPGVRVSLDINNRQVDVIAEGYDVVIRNGEMNSPALVGRRLGATPFILCASPSYLAAAPALAEPGDVAAHKVLAFHPTEERPQSWTLRRGDERATVSFTPAINANDGQVLLAATEAGMGLACLPGRLCRDALRAGAIVRCLPDWDRGNAETYALYPSRKALDPKVRAFIDHMVAEIDFAFP